MNHNAQIGRREAIPEEPTCSNPERVGSIRSGLAQTGANLDQLQKSLETLDRKLGPVFQKVPSAQGSQGQTPRDSLCDIGESVRSVSDRILEMQSHVESIIERLDV